MLRAFELVVRARRGARWIVAGPAGHGCEDFEQALAASPARANVEWLRYVPEDKLGALHARAGLFWFTSLDEGFGLPPLEAMARGLPTISSTRGSLPEVLGKGAQLLDPEDVESYYNRGLSHQARQEHARAEQLSARGLDKILHAGIRNEYPLVYAHFDRLVDHEHFRPDLKPYVEKLLSKAAA